MNEPVAPPIAPTAFSFELIERIQELNGATLALDASARSALFVATVDDPEGTPEEVTVDGVDYDRVETDPAGGEWTVDDEGRVVVNFS